MREKLIRHPSSSLPAMVSDIVNRDFRHPSSSVCLTAGMVGLFIVVRSKPNPWVITLSSFSLLLAWTKLHSEYSVDRPDPFSSSHAPSHAGSACGAPLLSWNLLEPVQVKSNWSAMGIKSRHCCTSSIFLLLPLLLQLYSAESDLQLNYYAQSCPNAEEIIKQQVIKLYNKHGNTAVSWVRNLFHDCIVKSCDASLLLETVNGVESEQKSDRSFGMRNFKYVKTIKEALEAECPMTVSCADIVSLSARDGIVLLGGPRIEMKTGRKDSKESYFSEVENSIPNHNDSIQSVLSRFRSIGIDTEGTVALLGAHSVGRVHCVNLVHRLYPNVDPTLDPDYAEYLKGRCLSPNPDPESVLYSRNDRETPMIIDNMYYKNLLKHKGLLMIDQQLTSDPTTSTFVEKMAADNGYFHDQFARAVMLLSENDPLTGDAGEIRKDCRYVNSA
ncbi:Peroxidase 21 [Hibiscus syriacus]|uniref:peroxidase n=2 Tax=Hibiscus syriacus TaxID=106335 RepID=A0A6A3CSU7_HIBSY|nr:Peroxidase 21 [Hibiscus syriacus]